MRKHQSTLATCAGIFFFMCTLSFSNALWAAEKAAAPVKVAVLPFTMHTPSDLAYLQQGIRDMFASRLAWQGKVQVLDRTATEQALRGNKSDLSLPDALKVGRTLNADYVLFGSVTGVGQAVSIDAKMAPLAGAGEPLNLYAQTRSLDEVIPQINQFAREINQKIFARTTDQAMVSVPDDESLRNRNPELLIPSTMLGGDKISYLNPNFVEVTPEGSLRQSGMWRSQTFKEGIVGMDIGDLDGDGRLELVTVTSNKILVNHREAYGLKSIATYNGGKMDQFLWVSLVDLDRDGKDEICVSSLHRRNDPRGNTTDQIASGRDVLWEPASFGLSMVKGKLQLLFENSPYFLNAIQFPKRGKVLLGQQKGSNTTFKDEIYEMQLRGKNLVTSIPVSVPSRCNVFNFAMADINNDGSYEIVLITPENRLFVLDASGNLLWKSRHRFAATTNYFTGKVMDLRYNQVDFYYIPSPIVATDLNKDNVLELVVNRSPDYSVFMPEGIKYYESGEILSLSWDQMGLIENWKTREISGMVTAIRVGDLNNDGTPELIATIIMAKDFLKLWQAQSTIVSYDLNIAPPKSAKLPQ